MVSQRDLSTARDVLLRILLMGFAPGVVLGAVFLVAQSAIPAVFTQDPGVISAVTHIVPLLALAMVRALCTMDRLTMPVLHRVRVYLGLYLTVPDLCTVALM